MPNPTLTYGTTTVILPGPVIGGGPNRLFDERRIQKRTLSGVLRTTVLSYNYVYEMGFKFVSRAIYDDVRRLWTTAVNANDYPTFNYVDAFDTAVNVKVSVQLGPAESAGIPGDFSTINFSLQLVEVNPR